MRFIKLIKKSSIHVDKYIFPKGKPVWRLQKLSGEQTWPEIKFPVPVIVSVA